MENGKSLRSLLVVCLFGAIGFLIIYQYFINRDEMSASPVEEEGELLLAH